MLTTARILVLDDDAVTRRFLEAALGDAGFVVHTFSTIAHASAAIQRESYDLFLLDVMLPDGDGLSFCRAIRQRSSSPVIMLTVKGDLSDVVAALEEGADDYVLKPYRAAELIARVRAQLRRSGDPRPTQALSVRDLTIDRSLRDAFVAGTPAKLSQKEFELLDYLAQRAGKSVNRDTILQEVWADNEDVSEKILAVYMRRLRRKIETNPDEPTRLVTVRGFGYRLE